MKRAELNLVIDNAKATKEQAAKQGRWVSPEEAAQIDFVALIAKSRYLLQFAWLCILMPFKLVAWLWKLSVRTGIGIVSTFIRFVFGLLGIWVLAVMGYAIVRMLFHPLFVLFGH